MDTMSFISQSLGQVQQRLLATCDGLSQEQVLWRPLSNANNIGFILWHVARSEDRIVGRLQGKQPDLWESQGWYRKFDQPAESPDPGDRMGLQALTIPALDVLVDYLRDVHRQTMEFVTTLTAEALDVPARPEQPERTKGMVLRHMITHKNNHHGQIDYIRGLQEPSWDLPPGTGMVQQ